jgi:hypothetical protein
MSRARSKLRKSKLRSKSRSKTRSKSNKANKSNLYITAGKVSSRHKSKISDTILRDDLATYINKVYSKYHNADYKVLDNLREIFKKSTFRIANTLEGQYPLQIFHINENGVTYDTEKKIDRMEMNYTLFKNAITYAKKHKLPIPTTTMYLWVSDTHPYYLPDIDKKFPIMSYCSPANMDYILFPDESFACLQINQKYKGECKDFDFVKNLIIENHAPKKIDKVYFKGVPTTDRQSRLREDLEKIATKDDKVIIKLDAWESYEPLYIWSKYKWLLNLPGRYPWSNRFRWLFLMKSGVINIDLRTIGGDYVDEPYMSFINLIVKPDIDYINIHSNYNNKIRPGRHPEQKDLDIQYAENKRVYNEIIKRTESITPTDYNKMVKSGFDKVNAINNDLISLYIYNLILANAKLIKNN